LRKIIWFFFQKPIITATPIINHLRIPKEVKRARRIKRAPVGHFATKSGLFPGSLSVPLLPPLALALRARRERPTTCRIVRKPARPAPPPSTGLGAHPSLPHTMSAPSRRWAAFLGCPTFFRV
jgi:hypothetical protein